jgi:hypothetical protein
MRVGERRVPRSVSLIGAYHPAGAPLEQRRLALELRLRVALAPGPGWGLVTSGVVTAEGLAARARAEVEVRLDGTVVRTRASFPADDGRAVTVALAQRFDRITIRRITELSGAVLLDGVPLGPARLRLDWRSPLGW